MIITEDTTAEFPSEAGRPYIFSASGDFGGGAISLQWSDGTEWVSFDDCVLFADGTRVATAPAGLLRFLVEGTDSPNISANVFPDLNGNLALKSDLGLSEVDNTSDSDKPLSQPQRAALAQVVSPAIVSGIPDLVGWWRASSLTNSIDATVTSWSSLNGEYTLTGTAVKGTNSLGEPCLTFSGAEYFELPANVLPSGMTQGMTIVMIAEGMAGNGGRPVFNVDGNSYQIRFDGNYGGGFYAHGVTTFHPLYTLVPRMYALSADSTSIANTYIDGIKRETLSAPYLSPVDSVLRFGRKDAGLYWFGKISEILIFSRKLSDAEVSQLYASFSFYHTPKSNAPLLALEGDSISSGEIGGVGSSWACIVATALGASWEYYNFAIGGRTAATVLTQLPNTMGSVYGGNRSQNIALVGGGGNDMVSPTGNSTPSATYASMVSICQSLKQQGYTVVIETLTPRTTSGFNANRNSLNSLIYAGWPTFADALCDFARDATIGPDAAAFDTSKYPDGIHPSVSSHTIMAALMNATIQTLLDRKNAPKVAQTFSGSTTIAAGSASAQIFTGSTATLTLPAPLISGVVPTSLFVKNRGSGNLTVASALGSQIYSDAAVSTVTIAAGAGLTLISDGVYWHTK